MEEQRSTTNVILILILVVVVLLGAWYYWGHRGSPAQPQGGAQIQVNLPADNEGTSGDQSGSQQGAPQQ